MQSITQIIAAFPEAFEHVVLAGAGTDNEYDALKARGFKHLTMLEADKERSQALSYNFADDSQVTVVHNALFNAEGEQKLTCFSNPDLNSLAGADNLNRFYPGIQETSAETVECVTLEKLNRKLGISTKENNLLILDIQGVEGLILSDTPVSELKKYRVFIIRTSQENLYTTKANGFSEAVNFFRQQQIDYLLIPEPMPPYVYLVAFRNAQQDTFKADNEKLIEQNRQQEQQIIQQQQTLTDMNSKLDKQESRTRSIKKQCVQIEKELVNLKHTKKDLTKQLSATHAEKDNLAKENQEQKQEIAQQQQSLVELNNKLQKQESEISSLEERHQQVEKEMSSLKHTKEDLAKQLNLTHAEKDNLAKENQKQTQEIVQLKQTMAELNRRLQQQETTITTMEEKRRQFENEMASEKNEKADLHYHLEQQQKSAQLSTKLLAKVEADASDLRERYAEKVKSEQDLRDLIKELHSKLEAASRFYHQLEQEHPELLEKL